ncbi:hypothetical protein ADK86_31595 [Streptomyces sp. NRRL F-5755]|uniref:iron-containing alcohol dehydrogenase n=1 Tax=Streptomyces sp. NRRL F-5755 TaxID=1519475 RepID=UPI0006ADB3AD|nr:iron-containing alcohol dehydrogenase [Streptomyces sp. NRRL F-5755]KOT88472.1 hypothetical protein ADK86_31595 [Streptomyces sp. NRRL F-5755]
MMGAHLAGQAPALSGLGLAHGMGHALTGIPHGVALVAVLDEGHGVQRPPQERHTSERLGDAGGSAGRR